MTNGPIENIVLKCLADSYGISGSLERLSGENLNYLLSTLDGERLVVKIVDDDMPDLQMLSVSLSEKTRVGEASPTC